MTDRPPTAFTEADAKAWFDALVAYEPHLTPTEQVMNPVAQSFACYISANGVTICFALNHDDRITVHLNPVLAQNLIENLINAGLSGGWLDEARGLTLPVVNQRQGRRPY